MSEAGCVRGLQDPFCCLRVNGVCLTNTMRRLSGVCVLQALVQGGNMNAVYAILILSSGTIWFVFRVTVWSFGSVAEFCWFS